MSANLPKSTILIAAVQLLLVITCADGFGQQATSSNGSEKVQKWILDLNGSFKDRRAATAALIDVGADAVEPLETALEKSSGERKLRIEAILKQLRRDSFDARLERLVGSPNVANAAQLPAWNQFAKTIGDDRKAIDFFIRMLRAERKLFSIATKQPDEVRNRLLRTELQVRAASIVQTAGTRAKPSSDFSIDSFAAVMLLASNNDIALARDTSTNINLLLSESRVLDSFRGANGKMYLDIAGAWMLRSSINVERPLKLARAFPTEHGLELARQTLRKTLRSQNGLLAMLVVKEQGSEADLSLLESLFENQGVISKGRRVANGSKTQPQYVAYNGDLALAVAIHLRKQDPREFGFGKNEPRSGDFRFYRDTIGFYSDEERNSARHKYAVLFKAE